eukprot:GHUV01024844.1.p1 GENE.GHUV01024844.1~~GHUV01024844.1.p1  ORF type:complete len:134 (-),score=18.77 GHUV01024844.1:478-879(-)
MVPRKSTGLKWVRIFDQDFCFWQLSRLFVCAFLWPQHGLQPPQTCSRQMNVATLLSWMLQMSRVRATRATERMREMLAENGPCSELTSSRVPLPLNPAVLLEGLLPQVGYSSAGSETVLCCHAWLCIQQNRVL